MSGKSCIKEETLDPWATPDRRTTNQCKRPRPRLPKLRPPPAMIDATGRTMERGGQNIVDRRYSTHQPPTAALGNQSPPKRLQNALSMV